MSDNKLSIYTATILVLAIISQIVSYMAVDRIIARTLSQSEQRVYITVSGNEVENVTETEQTSRVDVKMKEYTTKPKDTGFGVSTATNDAHEETTEYVFFHGRWIPCGVLTRSSGVNGFQGHGETYYNLDMSIVEANARDRIEGMEDAESWISDSGCKMLGEYIMVAAHPNRYGEVVETSLGLGLVVDSGRFYLSEPEQIDIATAW